MGFHVDYNGLDQLYSGIYSNASAWNGSITSLSEKVKTLVASSSMAGAGADNVKSYFDSVHNTVIPVLNSLLTAHVNNCLLYVRNYQSGIDTSLHAVIDEAELRQIKYNLAAQEDNADGIDSVVQKTLCAVSDIVDVSCTGFPAISDNNSEIQKLIDWLLTSICELEDDHYQSDFIDTSQLISSLKAFISEHLANARSYKADFSVESFAKSTSFIALAQAYVAVNAQIETNQAAVSQAIEEENGRIEALNAEIEARQKEANAEKWIVTGLCVIGSIVAIAVIVGSGGTATPLVVGTVSAVSGTVIAANNAAADEYVQHGWDTSRWDIESIGTSAVLGGVSGFITGYVGAGVSGAISNGLSSAGSTLLNSSSMAVRIGSNAVIGSTSQVISGVASRGATTFVTTMITSGGNVKTSVDAAWDSATNKQQILIDVATGGVSGGIKGIKKPTTVQPTHKEILKDGEQFNEDGSLKSNIKYTTGEHGYTYETNEDGLISHAETNHLEMKVHEGRLQHNANTIGKEIGDDAGHLFGDRFGGSPDLDNLVSQDGHLNRSEYKAMENIWEEALSENKNVTVSIDIEYSPGGTRPAGFDVNYTIDGEPFHQYFIN